MEEDGIEIKLVQPKVEKNKVVEEESESSQLKQSLTYQRKILIQANRIIQVKNNPISIQQLPYEAYKEQNLVMLVDHSMAKMSSQYVQVLINALVKIYNNKIYSAGKDLILMRSLKIKNIEIAKNDLLKSTASAIHMIDIKNS